MMHDPECVCLICREDSAREDREKPDFSRYAGTVREYQNRVAAAARKRARLLRLGQLAQQREGGGGR
jgi:hypothetical protein